MCIVAKDQFRRLQLGASTPCSAPTPSDIVLPCTARVPDWVFRGPPLKVQQTALGLRIRRGRYCWKPVRTRVMTSAYHRSMTSRLQAASASPVHGTPRQPSTAVDRVRRRHCPAPRGGDTHHLVDRHQRHRRYRHQRHGA